MFHTIIFLTVFSIIVIMGLIETVILLRSFDDLAERKLHDRTRGDEALVFIQNK